MVKCHFVPAQVGGRSGGRVGRLSPTEEGEGGGGGGRGHTLQAKPNPVEALDTGGPSYVFTK